MAKEMLCTGGALREALRDNALSIAGGVMLLTRIQQDREFNNHFVVGEKVRLYKGKGYHPKLAGKIGYLHKTAIWINPDITPEKKDFIEVLYYPKED